MITHTIALLAAAAAWHAPVQVASGEAHRGPWQQNDSDFRWVDDPSVAIDQDVGVVWADQSKKDVFFQRYGDDNKARLPNPTPVSKSPDTFSWAPRIAMNGKDVFVLWQEIVFNGGAHGGEIYFARSTDSGASFGAPMNLSNSIGGDGKGSLTKDIWDNGSLDLARGGGNELFAAWTEWEGTLWLRRSGDSGKTFGATVKVADKARGPSIAVYKNAVYVAWSAAGKKIQIAKSEDSGKTFGRPSTLFEGDAPKIAVDSKGVVHLAFAKGKEVQYSSDLKNSRRIDHANFRAGFPSMRIDGHDRVFVLWEEFLAPNEHPRGLSFASSVDNFAKPTSVPYISGPELGLNGSQQGLLTSKLAVNASGDIAVVNSTFLADKKSRVWLLRADPH